MTPITRYRRRFVEGREAPALAAARETVSIPLMPHPPLEEIERQRREYDDALEEARASGDRGRVKLAYYQASWATRVESQLRDGTAPTEVRGPVHAVRVGDGVIVTGPGETFTEYGIAVKERSPGTPTLYAGYTNEILGYLPTANEYQYGGYEAGYGYKSVGLPSLFDPGVERILVETGVRLAERLFPEAEPWDDAAGWVARGEVPRLPEARLEHPSRTATGPCREPGSDRGDRSGLLGLLPVPPLLPRPPRGRARGSGPQGRGRARRIPQGVRARGLDELGGRAARRRRRRRRRLVPARSPPRARRRGPRGGCARARREAHDTDAGRCLRDRRGGSCRRSLGGGRARLELVAHDRLGEGGLGARSPGAHHLGDGVHVELPDRPVLRDVRLRRARRRRLPGRGGDGDLGAGRRGRRLPVRPAARTCSGSVSGSSRTSRRTSSRACICSRTASTWTSRCRSLSPTAWSGRSAARATSRGGGPTPATCGSPAATACSCSTSTAYRLSCCSREDKERAEWRTLEPDPPAVERDAEYTCDGPAQFLVDACLGRERINRAPLALGVRTVAVMEAAWQSAHTGQPVRVADLVSV